MPTSPHITVLKPTRSAIAIRAVIFVVLVCLSLIAVDAWRSWNARESELQEMNVATSNLAQGMAQQANDTLKLADSILFGMVERIEYDGVTPLGLQRLHQYLVDRVAQSPQFNGIHFFDENGVWRAGSRAQALPHKNNLDREYFVFHRSHTDLGLHIGSPLVSRISGNWVIPLSRRVNHPDGSFAGVAVIAMDIAYFTQFYDKLNIGQAGSLALVLDNGTLLIRRPYNNNSVGRNVVSTDLYRAFKRNNNAGTLLITSSVDGVTRLNSYRSLYNYPLFAVAALSKNEILADWWRDTLLHTGGVVILVLILAVAGTRLVRQIELRTKTENELILARDALEKLNHTLEKLATLDGLTSLANRRKFDACLAAEFNRAVRDSSMLALVMIDVDQFKEYNDIYGHPAGDECLRTISQIIRGLLKNREQSLAARYGGEELVVLLPGANLAETRVLAEQIRLAIQQRGIAHSARPNGVVTVSIGVASSIPVRGMNLPGELVETADQALYAAKSAGRNRVCSAE